MKKVLILFLGFIFLFGCINQKEELELSDVEINVDEGKLKLIEAQNIGVIMDKRDITQENWVKVIQCAIGYSESLGKMNKTIISYGIDGETCLSDQTGTVGLKECSEHIKQNVNYSVYLVGGTNASATFYEDNFKIVVPENSLIECKINN